MIKKILDLKNQIVKVADLDEMSLHDLSLMKEEIALISNRTPKYYIVESSTPLKAGEDEIIALDSLWAHVNIALAKKRKGDTTLPNGDSTR